MKTLRAEKVKSQPVRHHKKYKYNYYYVIQNLLLPYSTAALVSGPCRLHLQGRSGSNINIIPVREQL